MSYDSNQFSSLINNIRDACDKKDLELVTDAMAVSLANIGVSHNVEYEKFLFRILQIIAHVYAINDIETNSDGVDSVH
jgi:hypothetical protein